MNWPDDFINKVICGDCLEIMPSIPDKSIDMILCDLPYGTTACKWDTVIPFKPLWENYKRIIKNNGAIALTAREPFTSALIMSNIEWFKYCWIWEKEQGVNFLLSKKQPMLIHEDITIFYNNLPTYNPVMRIYDKGWIKKDTGKSFDEIRNRQEMQLFKKSQGNMRYPISIIKFNRPKQNGVHPTQKPVALFEYLIKTYTNEGDLVLDNCLGSGTTAVACKELGRDFVGIETNPEYCKIAEDRLRQGVLG